MTKEGDIVFWYGYHKDKYDGSMANRETWRLTYIDDTYEGLDTVGYAIITGEEKYIGNIFTDKFTDIIDKMAKECIKLCDDSYMSDLMTIFDDEISLYAHNSITELHETDY